MSKHEAVTLRWRAQQARRLAEELDDYSAAQGLVRHAKLLEARAAQLEVGPAARSRGSSQLLRGSSEPSIN